MKGLNQMRFVLLLAGILALAGCEENEHQVSAKEVPEAVLQAFNQSYPGAVIKEYAEESEDGQHYFEISCEFQGRKIDALYKPDGAVSEIEEVISPDQLPEPVRQAITGEFPSLTIHSAESVEKEGQQLFEVKLLKDTKMTEVLFENNGRILKQESKELDEEADESEDD
jgi:hypothetical protein